VRRPVAALLQILRAAAVLAVLFGIGAAGSSFESKFVRGRDNGVFGNGVMALLGLRRPPDGEMFPVWIGRLCVVLGIATFIVITRVLDRAKTATPDSTGTPPPSPPWPPPG
jgi:hypothetical protein